jgi:uncharacterized protein (DUF697 family)
VSPVLAKSKGSSRFGAIGGARQLISLLRGMSLDAIEESVRQPPLILFVSDAPDAAAIAGELTGVRGMPSIHISASGDVPKSLELYDMIVVHNPDSNADFLRLRKSAGRMGHLVFDTGPTVDQASLEALRGRIASSLGDEAVALGRWYPAFRAAATDAIVSDTSNRNAQFALLSNVPSIVPVVGGIVAAGADTIVLTKNQLTMAIQIAAIYGKPLSDRKQIIRDLVPVIGGGFLWRTIAREGASFLPFAAGTIPKVAIAFAGTFATGKAVETYYRVGEAPSKDQVRGFYEQALQIVRKRFGKDAKSDSLPDGDASSA